MRWPQAQFPKVRLARPPFLAVILITRVSVISLSVGLSWRRPSSRIAEWTINTINQHHHPYIHMTMSYPVTSQPGLPRKRERFLKTTRQNIGPLLSSRTSSRAYWSLGVLMGLTPWTIRQEVDNLQADARLLLAYV